MANADFKLSKSWFLEPYALSASWRGSVCYYMLLHLQTCFMPKNAHGISIRFHIWGLQHKLTSKFFLSCFQYTNWNSWDDVSNGVEAGQMRNWSSVPGRYKRHFTSPQHPDQPPTQWVLWAVPPRVKQLGHEVDHSPPVNAKVKNSGAVLSFPHVIMAWSLIN
jgi:hypothetical protein